ncbi:hypothetical protein [Cupriavidus sp. YAF13]|uniref:hypothetical protein n=1 Tax=Cupriavidus sp. YAF13 TaxID=3233075 RepID=UPI003F8E60B3
MFADDKTLPYEDHNNANIILHAGMTRISFRLRRIAQWVAASIAIVVVVVINDRNAVDIHAGSSDDEQSSSIADLWHLTVTKAESSDPAAREYFSFTSQHECEKLRRELQLENAGMVSVCRISTMRNI